QGHHVARRIPAQGIGQGRPARLRRAEDADEGADDRAESDGDGRVRTEIEGDVMFKHICVPVDNSEYSNRAIDLAVELGRPGGARSRTASSARSPSGSSAACRATRSSSATPTR